MEVKIGNEVAVVKESSENLLIVQVPKRNVEEPTTVDITVANKYFNELLFADEKLVYIYLPPRKL